MQFLVCSILCFPLPTVLLTALGLSLPICVSLWMFSLQPQPPDQSPSPSRWHSEAPGKPHAPRNLLPPRKWGVIEILFLPDTIWGMLSFKAPSGLPKENWDCSSLLSGELLVLSGRGAATPTPHGAQPELRDGV